MNLTYNVHEKEFDYIYIYGASISNLRAILQNIFYLFDPTSSLRIL